MASPLDRLTPVLLRLGVSVPFLYYGIQLLAAPFFPHFSFLRNVASELGSDLSRFPLPFNISLMILGAITLLTSVGFLRAFWQLGTNRLLAILTVCAVALNGVQTMWAGYFPMPDPRHGGHPAFVIGMLLLPFLLTAALWKMGGVRLRAYFVVTLLLLACIAPLMSGVARVDVSAYRGLLQRLLALAIYPPIGVAAWFLAQRLRSAQEA